MWYSVRVQAVPRVYYSKLWVPWVSLCLFLSLSVSLPVSLVLYPSISLSLCFFLFLPLFFPYPHIFMDFSSNLGPSPLRHTEQRDILELKFFKFPSSEGILDRSMLVCQHTSIHCCIDRLSNWLAGSEQQTGLQSHATVTRLCLAFWWSTRIQTLQLDTPFWSQPRNVNP